MHTKLKSCFSENHIFHYKKIIQIKKCQTKCTTDCSLFIQQSSASSSITKIFRINYNSHTNLAVKPTTQIGAWADCETSKRLYNKV